MLNNLFTNEEFNKILISISIFLIIFLLRTIITYGVLKVFNWKKTKKEIKQIALYDSIKKFITLLGLYIAIKNLGVDEKYMTTIKLGFKILTILIFTIGTANSITAETSFLKKIQDRMKGENTDGMLNVIAKGIKFVIYLIGGFLIITELGYNLNGLAAGLGIGTVVVTLAAQDTAKSLIGGIAIFLDKPYKVGDYIKVDEYEGTVELIKFRSTNIRTLDDTVLHVPNSEMASASIINYGEIQKRRYYTKLILELDTPLEKIKQTTEQIEYMLNNRNDIIKDGNIRVKFEEIAENGYEISINAYTTETDYAGFLNVKEKVNYEVMSILHKEGIELAYNTQTLYVKNS